MRFVMVVCVAWAVLAGGCGDSEPAQEPQDTCACQDGACAEGECVLRVVVNDPCWGEAKIFLNDTSATYIEIVSKLRQHGKRDSYAMFHYTIIIGSLQSANCCSFD